MKEQVKKEFVTRFYAQDSETKEFHWYGSRVPAKSWEEAEEICKSKYPYMKVIGELVEEIETDIV